MGPSLSQAQTGEELSIRRLALERAESAQREERHAEALELAQRAGAIQMTPSVRFFIARELVTVGRRAEGLIAAQTCMREADQSPNTPNRDSIRANCRQIADAAQAQVGSVVVQPPAGPALAGLEVTVSGRPLSAIVLGLPYYVDPGAVLVTARAPGRVAFERTVTVNVAQSVSVALELPVAASSAALEPPPGTLPPRAVLERDPMAAPPERAPQPSLVGPALLWGVGGAALVVSGALLGVRESAFGACPPGPDPTVGVCANETERASATTALSFAPASGALLGVGVAAIGGGIAWWAVQRSSANATARVVTLVPARGGATVLFGGAL